MNSWSESVAPEKVLPCFSAVSMCGRWSHSTFISMTLCFLRVPLVQQLLASVDMKELGEDEAITVGYGVMRDTKVPFPMCIIIGDYIYRFTGRKNCILF